MDLRVRDWPKANADSILIYEDRVSPRFLVTAPRHVGDIWPTLPRWHGKSESVKSVRTHRTPSLGVDINGKSQAAKIRVFITH
jgi:hypothetical protein